MLQVFEQSKSHSLPAIVPSQKSETDDDPKGERGLFCKECRTLITLPRERIAVDGQHLYRFSNPHGIIFLIGCFRTVRHCWAEGKPEEFWSWFPDHAWQIIRCEGCGQHLGWKYSNSHDVFFGLVMTSLMEGAL